MVKRAIETLPQPLSNKTGGGGMQPMLTTGRQSGAQSSGPIQARTTAPQQQPAAPAPAPQPRQPLAGGVPQGFTSQQMEQTVSAATDPIQAQLAQAQARLQQLQRGGGAFEAGNLLRQQGANTALAGRFGRQQAQQQLIGDQQARVNALMQQLNRARAGAQEDALTQSGLAQRDEIRQRVVGGAEGRVNELRNDPTDQLILQTLQQRIRGEDVPFTDEVVNSLFSQASDQSASAAQAQLGRLPGRPGDASREAAAREIMANRQLSNQQSRQDIGTQRAMTNFAAVTQALGQGGAFNQARNAQITDAERFLSNILSNIPIELPDNPGFQDFLRIARMREGRA